MKNIIYRIDLSIFDQDLTLFVGVSKDIPEEHHDLIIEREVYNFVDEGTSYKYFKKMEVN